MGITGKMGKKIWKMRINGKNGKKVKNGKIGDNEKIKKN